MTGLKVAGTIFIGVEADAVIWATETYKLRPDVFKGLDKVTYMREFMRWMRLSYDPPHCAVVELPPRLTQVQLLKSVEDMKSTNLVFYTSAVNAALPTLRGRCNLVRGPEPKAPDAKVIDKLIDCMKGDSAVHVALYRESGDIDKDDLVLAIKASQFTASGERAMTMLAMHAMMKSCKSSKEFVVNWLWGR